jgi:sarcosine oxidase subunit delta
MLLIECPYCGERDESEFSYGGEAHNTRPLDPYALSDEEWADYVFYWNNPKGLHRELWNHSAGCRRWFNAIRDTVTYKFQCVYKIEDPQPSFNKIEGKES